MKKDWLKVRKMKDTVRVAESVGSHGPYMGYMPSLKTYITWRLSTATVKTTRSQSM